MNGSDNEEVMLNTIWDTFLVPMILHILIFFLLIINFLSKLSENLNSIDVDMINYCICMLAILTLPFAH